MRLIDREALCQDLLNRWNVADEKEEEEIQNVMADVVTPIVFSQPTIELPSWIPCSERLPEPLEEVLITWVNVNSPNYYASMKGVPHTDEAVYFRGDWYWWDSTIVDVLGEYGKMRGIEPIKGIDITAWQPLPEPYREDGEL